MESTLAWLDHDSSEQERMRGILQLFEEKGTVDEMGIGGIRDSIADQLFPGTSTIQTRLRYFLFVPWIYRRLEESRVPPARIPREARELQFRLCEALLEGGEREGVIGRWGGRELVRTPDAIYWNGLAIWGIRRYPGSLGEYQDAIERIRQLRALRGTTEEGTVEPDDRAVSWHPGLPDPPTDWLDEGTFDLTWEEADLIRDRLRLSCSESLLGFLAREPRQGEYEAAWEHAEFAEFPDRFKRLLHHARIFSAVIEGAVLLYNVMLAREARAQGIRKVNNQDIEQVLEDHQESFEAWVARLDVAEIRAWDLPMFWNLVAGYRYRIAHPTRTFVKSWVELVVQDRHGLDAAPAHRLLEFRERRLKGPHARLQNRRALGQWGGASGLGRLTYRWSQAQGYLNELAAGLAKE